MGSLQIQTRAEELVAVAEVKNCVAPERDKVKNCKRQEKIARIAGIAKIAKIEDRTLARITR